MRLAVGADHAGFDLEQHLIRWLESLGHEVLDVGPRRPERCDYPDFAHRVADEVAKGTVAFGLLVCGTGVGMAMAANRHLGVRAVTCHDLFTAQMSRRHNDANILALGSRIVAPPLAEAILSAFLTTEFDGGRHRGRVEKIDSNIR